MNLAAKKLGFPKNAPEKPCVCSNARDGVFIERPAQSRNGLFPAVAPGDEFAQQRVVIVGYGPAFVDALVKADSRAAWNLPGENFSRRWEEIVFREKLDRKSTRLNSSHVEISYAVFCLKKKKQNK